MKKSILLVAVLLMSVVVMARPVDATTARRVAEVFLGAQGMRNTAALVDVTAETPFTEFYVFASPEGGFVLVSGDDCVIPVLGYSTTSRFETQDIPEHILAWYESYEKEISKVAASAQPSDADGQWKMLLAGAVPPAPLTTAVSPMLTTTWNQGNYYNTLCPYHDSTAARSVTGCVATATAQVMKFWNHPATGYGSHTYTSTRTKNGITYNFPNLTANFGATTYDWNNMPNALTGVSSAAQVNAVATLMYHVGVADEMSYSPVASGAHNYNRGSLRASSQTSLMKYFKYRSDMAAIARADYSDDEYSALLRAELDQNRPILYSGSHTSGGHSFVFDGYDNSNRFHVNWGWGGSHDGYFMMGSLNPGTGGIGGNGSGTYNMDNVVLIGIQPNDDWSTTATTTVAVNADLMRGTVSGSGVYAFGDTVTMLAMAADGYRFSGWSDGCKFNPREIIATGGSYTFTAVFDALEGDTLHYCPGNYQITSYGYGSSGGNNYWGIRLPYMVLGNVDTLKAVQLFVVEAGTYDVTIYTGSGHTNVAAADTVTFTSDDEDQWKTVTLTTPVVVDADIWIIFHYYGSGYPQSATYYGGAAGSFIAGSNFEDKSNSRKLSAMVKGIFVGIPRYTVTAESNNTQWGIVYGGDVYREGETATLMAVPTTGYRFVKWQDNDSNAIREVVVTCDTSFTATFEAKPQEGIDDVDMTGLQLYPNPASDHITIVLNEALGIENGEWLTVLDVTGRTVLAQPLAPTASQTLTLDVSTLADGLYFVRLGAHHASLIIHH
ncbi:MAG: thiol protease/hemagglutinin PrtT [Bacteroidales bacterium]|nr:thiol protease/hemagglutinin PrtT [Bacteroidales bacterium]